MKLRFLWVGDTKDPLLSRVEERYFKRVKQHFPVEKAMVPDLKKSNPHQQNAQLIREARQIERKLPEKTYTVVLDSEGEEFTSRALASFLEKLMNRGVSEVTFVMGGHLGVHEKVKEMADQKISLTKLTLPHELARVLLLEQIYRAVDHYQTPALPQMTEVSDAREGSKLFQKKAFGKKSRANQHRPKNRILWPRTRQ